MANILDLAVVLQYCSVEVGYFKSTILGLEVGVEINFFIRHWTNIYLKARTD